jgi:uncharacterized delta-60 repeat protein
MNQHSTIATGAEGGAPAAADPTTVGQHPPAAGRHRHPLARRGGFGRSLALGLLGLFALLGTHAASAFDPNADGSVFVTAAQPDGGVVIAGQFGTVGGVPRSGFARLLSDGSVDTTYYEPALTLPVWAMAVQADGKTLVGGRGLQGTGGLLRINADGSLDSGFVDAFSAGDVRISKIVPLPNGKILVGGTFATVGAETRAHLARLNADGSLDTGFDAGNATPYGVNSLAVQADGRIVVVGYETLLRLTADGQPDIASPLPPLQSGGNIQQVAIQSDGAILIAGGFLRLGDNINRGALARITAAGGIDEAFAPAVEGSADSLFIDPNDDGILLGGGFGSVGGEIRRGFARLHADGSLDLGFEAQVFDNVPVVALARQADGKIVIGGYFSTLNGLVRNHVARLHPDGRVDDGGAQPAIVTPRASDNGSISPDTPQPVAEGGRIAFTLTPAPGYAVASVGGCGIGSRSGNVYTTDWVYDDCTVAASFVPQEQAVFTPDPNGDVEDIAVLSGGRLLAGGWFSHIGGLPKIKFARLDATGSADPAFADGTGIYHGLTSGDVVYATAVQADGKALIGGQHGLLRINTDGAIDSGFVPALGADASLHIVVPQPDGKILVAGSGFELAKPGIARLNADGSVDNGFALAFDTADFFELLPDGRLYIGGYSADIGLSTVARFHADGQRDETFPLLSGTGIGVLARQPDGALIVGSNNWNPVDLGDGVPADSHVVRLLPNGLRDVEFQAVVSGGPVESIALQPDGKIFIGGGFTEVNGQTRRSFARLNADGSLDAAVDAGVSGGWIKSIKLQADDRILIAGSFTQVAGYARRGLARLKADGRIDIDAFVVTPLAAANGTISPNTPQSVNPGEQAQFLLIPDPGYVIGAVSGCGGSLDGLTYTTGTVVAHCAVTVDFLLESRAYTVTPAAGPHGSLSPSTPQSVLFAQTTSFSVTPAAGYYLADVEGCGGELSGSTYTTERILADCAVLARFHQPATLAASGGTPQITAVNTGFALPLTVRIDDANGLPVAGVEVTFAAPGSGAGALLSATTAITDANGEASITARANGSGGAYVVTASAGALSGSFALRNDALDGGGIEFKVTLSREPPPACGTATELDAVPGEPINYCFTATNRSDVALNYHTLTMLTFGHPYQYEYAGWDRYFSQFHQPIPPGGTYRYNRIINAGTEDQAPQFTWNSTATLPDYEVDADASVAFTDISSVGTPVPLAPARSRAIASLPFPIAYFGQVFHAGDDGLLCINNSGSVFLRRALIDERACPDSSLTSPPLLGDNYDLAGMSAYYHDGLAVYWDLLGGNGAVYYATVGSAPNRRLIVQWNRKDHALYPNPSQGITFQVVFEEGSGKIHYIYDSLAFDVLASPNPDRGGSATVGLFGFTNQADWPYRQHSFDSAVLSDGQSITWTPTDVLHYATAAVAVEVGAPHLNLTAGELHASTAPGTQVQATLGIGNDGEAALAWSIDEAAARAHFPPPGTSFVRPPDSAGHTLPPLPAVTAADVAPIASRGTAFAVPAYANTPSHWFPDFLGMIAFDASNPTQFMQGVGVPWRYGEPITAADFAHDDFTQVYVLGNPNGANGEQDFEFAFTRADAFSGDIAFIGNAVPADWQQAPYHRWGSLAWDGSSDTMFAATTTLGESTGIRCESTVASDLYSIDLDTGAATRVGAIDAGTPVCIRGLAAAPDGALYGIDTHNNALVAIDKSNGEAAIVGWLGFNIGNEVTADFDDSDGTLYFVTASVVYTVDLVTGLAQVVAPLPLLGDADAGYSAVRIEGLSIALAGGDCADPAQVPWLSFNQLGGETPPGEESNLDVRLDATGLAPGDYAAQLCLHGNDRSQALVRIPVALTVTGDVDDIFADSFESAP